ncbi:MAG: hypothetical protein AVDCRST_MAG87-2050, partial [uncultured Thermomicrobiales bacterium]
CDASVDRVPTIANLQATRITFVLRSGKRHTLLRGRSARRASETGRLPAMPGAFHATHMVRPGSPWRR